MAACQDTQSKYAALPTSELDELSQILIGSY